MNTLKQLYKKRDKINSKIKKLDKTLVQINQEISKIEYENMLKANNIILDQDFIIKMSD